MDQHFKLCRAKEEIQRLNVEIRRLITYMHDEELLISEAVEKYSYVDPPLSHQIELYGLRRSRFNDGHRKRLLHSELIQWPPFCQWRRHKSILGSTASK